MSFEIYLSYYTDFPGITDKDRLEPLFCVDSMEITRIMASNMRPPLLTNIAKKQLKIDKVEDLIGKEIYIIRRKLDSNGNKIDNVFRYVSGIVKKQDIVGTYSFSLVTVLTEYGEENIRLSRLFIQK